jgi:hypothetical protein
MKTNRIRNLVLAVSSVALVGVLVISQGLVAWPAAAQTTAATTTPSDLTRTITVVGKGTVTIKPDTAQATLGVETMGKNVKDATAESSATMEAIIKALTALGIAEKDIQTSGFSVWSERNPAVEGRLSDEVTYRVMNTVNVQVRDMDQVGAVLDAAIEAGANAVHGVSFYVDDTDKIESDARAKAVVDARAKAEELAKLNDVKVGVVISVSEVVGGSVPYSNFNMKDMAYAGMGGGAGPISPGELDMSTTLQISYAIQ